MARRSHKQHSPFESAPKYPWLLAAAFSAAAFLTGFVLAPALAEHNPAIKASIAVIQYVVIGMGVLLAFIALLRYVKSRPGRDELPPSSLDTIMVLPRSSDPTLLAAKPKSRSGKTRVARREIAEAEVTKPTAWSLALIQSIEWKRFEELCSGYYREKGMRGETTPLGADGGIEIRLFQDDANTVASTATSIVRCKAWDRRQVGIETLQELLDVMRRAQIDRGFFMTSGSFSDAAKEFANANRIVPVDGKLFLAMIQRLSPDVQQHLLDFATSGDFTTPTCPSCGIKMLRRESSKGQVWGCRNYPTCSRSLQMR